VTDPAVIAAEIDRIRSLGMDALGRRWRAVFGRKPPAGLSREVAPARAADACRISDAA